MEEEQAERALLEEFVEPLLRDVRRTIADTFVVEWFVAEEMWWWSCRGTSATLCERGDVRASVSGSHRWELLADLSETIADNAFDEGPVWPLCPTHKNHSLNAKAP